MARRARHGISADGSLHTLTLYDGERFEGVPGQPVFRIVRFAENVIPVRLPAAGAVEQALEALPTATLRASADPERRAEYHWRVALSVMPLVLALLAVPLSRLRPRQGRYARIGLAVVVYFLYVSLVSAAKVWLMRGATPDALGLWWVHALVIGVVLGGLSLPAALARWRHRPAAVPT